MVSMSCDIYQLCVVYKRQMLPECNLSSLKEKQAVVDLKIYFCFGKPNILKSSNHLGSIVKIID